STFYFLLSTFLSSTFYFAVGAAAQDAVPPDLTGPNEGLSAREIQTLQGQPAAPAGQAVSGQQLAETPRRLNYGLTVTARGVYDDNINISSFNHVSDYYVAIEPSLFAGFGGDSSEGASALSLMYRPSLFLFINHSENDTVQHVIRLQANHNFGRLTGSLSQDVQILNGADLNSISDPTGHNAN